MTETEFGPGMYAYTYLEAPTAPVLTEVTSVTVNVAIWDDANASFTEYAIYNETDGNYIDSEGNATSEAIWQSRDEWGAVTVCCLNPVTEYTFKVKARNYVGIETEFGPSAQITTYNFASNEFSMTIEIQKVSSTISAPAFMSGLSTSIRLAGKSLNELGFHVDRISGLDVPSVVPDEELIPGNHTWHIWDEYFAPKRIVLNGHVHDIV